MDCGFGNGARRGSEICTVGNLAPEISQSAKCRRFGNKNTQAPLLLTMRFQASRREQICVSENSPQRAMMAGAIDDVTLVHASKTGDIAAFEELVKRYDSKLLRIAQHVTHNREDAQDAVQEAFLKAFQKLEQFRENSKFSTWLVRIAINQSLMRLRKQHRKSEVAINQGFQTEEEVLSPEITDWAPNPEERCRASEIRQILIKTLRKLRPNLSVVFVLRDIEGLSTEETASALNLSQAAVKTRLLRARLQLREELSKYFRRTGEFAGVGEIPQLCGIKACPGSLSISMET
jgi:RNA polymerase sigma-70 factor, ECF subfamily